MSTTTRRELDFNAKILMAATYRIHWECGIQMNEAIADSAFVLTIGGFTAWMMLPTFCNFEFYI